MEKMHVEMRSEVLYTDSMAKKLIICTITPLGDPMANKCVVHLITILIFSAIVSCVPQPPPSLAPTSEHVSILVYFTDTNLYATGTPPFEVAVTRTMPASLNLAEAVLQAFFAGPTSEEHEQGLEAITSGFTGVASLVIEDGIARVYLTGKCASMGATYTVAQPIMRNLFQFPDVSYVKIYDENGETEVPEEDSNSIPFCLEP
jgi:hypothetical protein